MTDIAIEETNELWVSAPVTSYKGPLKKLKEVIPTFRRCSFGFWMRGPLYRGEETLFDSPEVPPGCNPYFDTIVRMPLPTEDTSVLPVPVGIVSGNYTLLQHHHVIDEVIMTLEQSGFDSDMVTAQMDLTALGERMRLNVFLPEKFHLAITPEDRIALRLICTNSVDGSVSFSALTGWFRFVCSNGMILGVKHRQFRQRHNRQMNIDDLLQVVNDGIEAATKERSLLRKWHKHHVSIDTIGQWVDTTLSKSWGVKAAVRAWHILNSGYDVELADPFETGKPTQKTVVKAGVVPGAIVPGDSMYAAAQALAWLAKERRDVQEQQQWTQQIPGLVASLQRGRQTAPALSS